MLASRRAFSLAEVLLAIAILAMAIVALFNLAGSAIKNASRTESLALAGDLAERELSRAIYSVTNDQPAGSLANFWNNDFLTVPLRQGNVMVNNLEFQFAIYAQTLNDAASGSPVGMTTVTSNRVKKVDIEVYWMQASATSPRQGYGRLRTGATRIVNEVARP